MAVFRRHLLAQTFGRAVLPIPVLVVTFLGARRPGIPASSRSSFPVKNYNRRRERSRSGEEFGIGGGVWGRERRKRREREKGRGREEERDRERERGKGEQRAEQRVATGIDNATGYAREAPKLFRSFPRVNWRRVMQTNRLISRHSRYSANSPVNYYVIVTWLLVPSGRGGFIVLPPTFVALRRDRDFRSNIVFRLRGLTLISQASSRRNQVFTLK